MFCMIISVRDIFNKIWMKTTQNYEIPGYKAGTTTTKMPRNNVIVKIA